MKQPATRRKTKTVHPKAPITFRRNILPPLLGILMAVGVMGLLNEQLVEAQVRYYLLPVRAATVEPVSTLQLNPNAPARITVPSVGIDAPFVTNEISYDPTRVQQALRNGVVHYGTTALPGQVGNVVAIGHSSGQLWSPGHYKYAFTLLNKVALHDLVYIDYHGTRYIYRVTSRETVSPTDLDVLNQTNASELTMITCTPVGISTHRLVLHAQQISPSPTTNSAKNAVPKPVTATELPR